MATYISGELGIYRTYASYDIVAACAGFSYGLAEGVRLLQEVQRPVLLVCAEKFSDKIGSVRTSRMLFGDGAAAAGARAGAPDGEPADIEYLQTYASGPVSQVNSIIWPNPEFDNNITVYGPEVKALAERYLAQMIEEMKDTADPAGPTARCWTRSTWSFRTRPTRRWSSDIARAAGLPPTSSTSTSSGREHLGGQHPARHPRRGRGRRDRPADARSSAGLRGRRGRRLHGHADRPRDRRSRTARAGRADDVPEGERGPLVGRCPSGVRRVTPGSDA